MALATTCPQCKTSFKVIPDQLKLRRGLVRCGVCQHVFSGIDYLRYVDDSGKARQKAAAGASGPGSGTTQVPAGPPGAAGDRAAGSGRSSASASGAAGGEASANNGPGTRFAPAAADPAAASNSPQTIIAADEDLKTAFFLSDSTFGPYSQARAEDVAPPRSIVARDVSPQPRAESGRPAREGEDAGARHGQADLDAHEGQSTSRRNRGRSGSLLGAAEDDDPEVAAANLLARQARDAYRGGGSSRRSGRSQATSRWPGSAEALGPDESWSLFFADRRRRYGVLALLVLAALQSTLLFRSEIASRVPPLRPVLAALAAPFGLGVDAVRSLGSLSIESFELQATGREDHLSLNAVLRNKDPHVVRWPAMELILTDQSSTVVVRKVILPSDYLNRNASRDGLSGRSEWPIRLNLDPGGLQLAGYSVALFYP
jgi:predicted Zn finger-like uncharacterized protein